MKIIILGAQSVGIELARYLVTAGHAITLVDTPSEELSQIGSHLDLRVVEGNPASPEILRLAGAENTELLVATTSNDEINITACCIATFLFNVPRKIARIRSAEYLRESDTLFGEGNIPIDHVIAPEHVITDEVLNLIELPGTTAVASLCGGRVTVASAQCVMGGKLIGKSVLSFPEYEGNSQILAIYRDGKLVKNIEENKEVFRPGDEVFFCCGQNRALSQLSALLPIERIGRNITIAGGTHIADEIARRLSGRYRVKLIEPDHERSIRSANRLHDTSVEVYNADPTNVDFMMEEYINKSDLFIAASQTDGTNIMASFVLSRLRKGKTLAIIRSDGYFELAAGSHRDINNIVSPKDSLISALLSQIRQEGVEAMHLFRQGKSEVLELKIEGTKRSSNIIGRTIANLTLPEGVFLGMVWRRRKLVRITKELIFEEGDHVIAYLDDHRQMRALVKLFRPHSFWIPKW
ncbi:MAG: Trk system potassium transporter TrkA [Succinivibrio sp.]|nr:Trk system potassium transporter TrkA [Succinivibrio sp.]